MTERRFENRFACADLVRVDWLEAGRDTLPSGSFCSTEGVLEDISRVGACVQVEIEIPLGSTIIIRLGREQFCGSVCYCVFRDYGYFVGVNFNDESAWSSAAGRPAHLTDLTRIASQADES